MYRHRRMPITLGEKNEELIIFVMKVVCMGENVCIYVVAGWCEAAVGTRVYVCVERRECMVGAEDCCSVCVWWDTMECWAGEGGSECVCTGKIRGGGCMYPMPCHRADGNGGGAM